MGEPQMGEPQMGEPQMGEPQMGEPQMGEPQMGEPQMGEPEMGEPQICTLGPLVSCLQHGSACGMALGWNLSVDRSWLRPRPTASACAEPSKDLWVHV
jgi:hypothetical protein